jgi:5'-3' exonuclease
MGIPKFFGRFILGKYKDRVATNTLPSNDETYIDTVEFDLGGILHHAAQVVFSYGAGYDRNRSRELVSKLSTANGTLEVEREFCIKVTDEIEKLVKAFIEEVNPKYKKIGNLVIAMDGVAPFAKIIQQRTRRYRTSLADEETKGVNVDILPSWDSNSITPGTSFIDKFDRHMRGWITEDNIRNLVYNKIIFSSYRKRGEGEHKLFGFRRANLYDFDEEIKTTDKSINVCYGSDADLILLNLKDEYKNVYIVRDKDAKVNPKNRLVGTEDHGVVVNIDVLRDILVDEMTGRTKKDNISKFTYYSVVRDFILLTFFLGNDFLPKVFCFSDLTTSLTEFMRIYNKYIFNGGDKDKGKQITSANGFLCREDGAIEWDVFVSFMERIQKLENKYLLALGKGQKKDVRPDKNMENNSLALDVAITTKNINFTETREVETEYYFDENKFRNKWYNLVLGPRTEAMKVFLDEHGINYVSESSSNEMYKLYLTGLQWVLLYYIRGTLEVNKFWSYTYTQAPMMSDIYLYTKKMLEEGGNINVSKLLNKSSDPPFGPVHQLLSVMPVKSKSLIPKSYDYLTSGLSKLSYIAPHTFGIDYESASLEHEGLAILPSIDPLEIIKVVNLISSKKKVDKDLLGTAELETVIVKGVRTNGMKYTDYEIRALRKKGYDFINKFGKPPSTSKGKRDDSPPQRKASSHKKPSSFSKGKPSSYKKRDDSPPPRRRSFSHKKDSSSSPSRGKKPYKKREELSMKVRF